MATKPDTDQPRQAPTRYVRVRSVRPEFRRIGQTFDRDWRVVSSDDVSPEQFQYLLRSRRDELIVEEVSDAEGKNVLKRNQPPAAPRRVEMTPEEQERQRLEEEAAEGMRKAAEKAQEGGKARPIVAGETRVPTTQTAPAATSPAPSATRPAATATEATTPPGEKAEKRK